MTIAVSAQPAAGGPRALRATPSPALSPFAARTALALVVVAAGALGFAAIGTEAGAGAAARAGADLTRLLRAMAAIKAAMALGVTAAVLWRLGSPIGPVRLAAYGLSAAAMAAGPCLIWSMADVALGAALLHGGLLASVLLLWRDPVLGKRLAALIDRRRRRLAA